MFEKQIVIDGKQHLVGRLAAVIAKELLNGQRIVLVRAEELVKSGPLYKNKMKYVEWLTLKSNTNPRHGGPYHFKSPARLFWRVVRGMVRHKTARGTAALERLRVYEGCPAPYSHMKRQLVPSAMRATRLGNGRKFCRMGDLCSAIGWNKNELVTSLEEKRKTIAGKWFARKVKDFFRKNTTKPIFSTKPNHNLLIKQKNNDAPQLSTKRIY
jgi:large subunit ribosomal protein L13Ae